MVALPPHPPIPFASGPADEGFESPDPADIYASRYRQLLPPHPSRFEHQIRPSSPESLPTIDTPCEYSPLRPMPVRQIPFRQMPPLADIGRHSSSPSKRHARSASNSSSASSSSRRERQSLPRIEEVPDLDYDTSSISSGSLSRSDSGASSNYDARHSIYGLTNTYDIAQEYFKMDRREAAIKASMERTSWMIDEDGESGKGSRDLVEHINYVLSAWQRDR